MSRNYFFFCVVSLVISGAAMASECPYGKLLGFEDAGEFVARAPRTASKQYSEEQVRFIKGARAAQIKKTFATKSVAEAFASVDEGVIFKFEVNGNERTPYNFLTVIFAHQGDTLVGAIFTDDSSEIVAKLSDSDIQICEPYILN